MLGEARKVFLPPSDTRSSSGRLVSWAGGRGNSLKSGACILIEESLWVIKNP